MISLLNKFIFLNILKWKITGDVPTDKKLIFAVGPHTSAYDFFVGLFFRSHLKMENQIKFIGKAELFQIPIFGLFLRSIGGIPVIRNKSNNSVDKYRGQSWPPHENRSLGRTITIQCWQTHKQ